MPKTIAVTSMRVSDLCLTLGEDDTGVPTITRLAATLAVSYGGQAQREVVDLLLSLTAMERTRLDTMVARLLARLNTDYLA